MNKQAAAALVLLTSLCTAQKTWIVDAANGPGTNYTVLADGIAAANVNDIVIVRAGTYKVATITKGIRLLADPGVDVQLTGGHGGGGTPLRVRDLPAGQTVVIRGLKVSSTSTRSAVLWLTSNKGVIQLENLMVLDSKQGGGHILLASDCAAILMNGCRVDQGARFERCKVTITDSHLERSSPGTTYANVFPSLAATDSTVIISGSAVLGENGGALWPQPAASVKGTRIEIAAGAASRFIAGAKTIYSVDALVGDANSRLALDPGVKLVPSGSGKAHNGFGSVTTVRLGSVSVSGGVLGEKLTLELRAPENATYATWLGVPGLPVQVGHLGDAWLDLKLFLPGPAGVMGSAEYLKLDLPVPARQAYRGLAVGWQGYCYFGGRERLTNMAAVTLR